MKSFITFLLLIVSQQLFSQVTFPRNGVKDEREKLYAFTHATVFTDYQTMIADATLIIRDGRIESIGINQAITKGAIVTDLKGKFIYPSFIDIYSDYGMPAVAKPQNQGPRDPQFLTIK